MNTLYIYVSIHAGVFPRKISLKSILFLVDAVIFPSKKSLPVDTPTQSSLSPQSDSGNKKILT